MQRLVIGWQPCSLIGQFKLTVIFFYRIEAEVGVGIVARPARLHHFYVHQTYRLRQRRGKSEKPTSGLHREREEDHQEETQRFRVCRPLDRERATIGPLYETIQWRTAIPENQHAHPKRAKFEKFRSIRVPSSVVRYLDLAVSG